MRQIYEDNASGKLSDERYATLGHLPYGGYPEGQSFCFGLARAEWKIENGEWKMENERGMKRVIVFLSGIIVM